MFHDDLETIVKVETTSDVMIENLKTEINNC